MPREVYGSAFPFLPHAEILSFEEITRVAKLCVSLGVRKVRLTGGEPLLRAELPVLVSMLNELGVELALTTNGSLLAKHAAALHAAGLTRVTVSLDALDEATFAQMTDTSVPVAHVLSGIQAARDVGLGVKVNCVVRRGVNEGAIGDLAAHFRSTGVVLRFIEFMDVGITNGWNLAQVVRADEILQTLEQRFPLSAVPRKHESDVARRYHYNDGSGEIGIIASVTQPFCSTCSRLRLSANGQLFTCLFASQGLSLKQALRDGSSDERITSEIRELWQNRSDAYSEQRSERTRGLKRVEMSFIGG
jgi:cyclic pyranopterin phosphate synthase